jgi:uncharacterized protein (TIGR03437 family)
MRLRFGAVVAATTALLGAFSATGTALAQPQPAGPVIAGVVDSASYSAYIAWGELVSIFGTNLSDGGTYQAQTVPLPTQLGTTQVFSTNATCEPMSGVCTLVSLGEPLELLYVSPTQINLRMSTASPPQNCHNVGGQCVNLAVKVGSAISSVWDNGYALYAPALFSSGFDCPYLGWPNGGATNVPCGLSWTQKPGQLPRPVVTDANYSLITNSNPARLGQAYVLWLTGLGNPEDTGDLRSKFPTLRMELSRCCLPAYFAGLVGDASVFYAGIGSGFPGLYQMNFILPTLSKSSIGYGTTCGSELRIEVWASVVANNVSADGGGTGSNYLSIPVYVSASENLCPATNALTSSLNPSAPGQAVTFTATVAPATATGTVTFLDGSTVLGSGTLSNGVATFSSSTLAAGTHSITATYNGDSNYGGSSATLSQTVSKTPTTTTLTSSLNPSVSGESVTFTATISPSTATGTVTFFDGSSTLGSGTLSGGKATCFPFSNLGAGNHSIKATYNGDSNYGGSSGTLTQVVKLNAIVTLTSSLNPATFGQSVTFSATVSPCCIATGTVTFFDGSSTLGSGTLLPLNGIIQATFSTSSLSVGNHSITASYGGDTNDNGSTSAVLTQTVRPNTTITLTSSPNPSNVGQSVILAATVSPSTATGGVTFFDGSRALLTNDPMSGGKATISVPDFSAGIHPITAAYSYLEGNSPVTTSAALTQTVNAH